MGYLLIGDIHSQGKPLSKALHYAKENNLKPVFLGDVFDSRCEESQTLYVYNLLRLAQKEVGAVILNSNHQVRLRRFLKDDFDSPAKASETWRTLFEFKEAGVDLKELKNWLGQLPDGFSFIDKDGRQFCCAHAYFPFDWVDHDMKPGDERVNYAMTEQELELSSWGPYNSLRKRVRWWEDDSARSWTRVAGHYHTVHVGENNLVLDANSGYPDGRVPTYNSDTKEVVYFN